MDATDLPSGTSTRSSGGSKKKVSSGPSGNAKARRAASNARRGGIRIDCSRSRPAGRSAHAIPRHGCARRTHGAPIETRMIFRLSLALLRLFARVVPARDRDEWLAEWESELHARRARLTGRHRLTHEQELDMFRRVPRFVSRRGLAAPAVYTRRRSRSRCQAWCAPVGAQSRLHASHHRGARDRYRRDDGDFQRR